MWQCDCGGANAAIVFPVIHRDPTSLVSVCPLQPQLLSTPPKPTKITTVCFQLCHHKYTSQVLHGTLKKMMVFKRNLLFQGGITRFHVKLWQGTMTINPLQNSPEALSQSQEWNVSSINHPQNPTKEGFEGRHFGSKTMQYSFRYPSPKSPWNISNADLCCQNHVGSSLPPHGKLSHPWCLDIFPSLDHHCPIEKDKWPTGIEANKSPGMKKYHEKPAWNHGQLEMTATHGVPNVYDA